MSFDIYTVFYSIYIYPSQSLSIRAMSFDRHKRRIELGIGLNPFRSGQCLSTREVARASCRNNLSQSLSIRAMSFDFITADNIQQGIESQSLSIRAMSFDSIRTIKIPRRSVSIPFDQGNVFRQKARAIRLESFKSQSLSIRAMSFDIRSS